MCIWWIGIALYGLERDQSTLGILGWPARSRSTLGLQVDSDPVDHPRSGRSGQAWARGHAIYGIGGSDPPGAPWSTKNNFPMITSQYCKASLQYLQFRIGIRSRPDQGRQERQKLGRCGVVKGWGQITSGFLVSTCQSWQNWKDAL